MLVPDFLTNSNDQEFLKQYATFMIEGICDEYLSLTTDKLNQELNLFKFVINRLTRENTNVIVEYIRYKINRTGYAVPELLETVRLAKQ